MKKFCLTAGSCLLLSVTGCGYEEQGTTPAPAPQDHASVPPNIVYILADDLGYGDVGAYNPASKIPTPNIDALAQDGMRFTDAHASASVCTPSRYAIMTGEYGWRSQLSEGVLRGYGRALIEEETLTVGEMLQDAGYVTGVVGKWHLGIDWAIKPDYQGQISEENAQISPSGLVTEMDQDLIDFSTPPQNGPLVHGFGHSFILPASLDMPPYMYLEDDRIVTPPSETTPGNDLDTGYTGAFWRGGGIAPDFEIADVLPTFTAEAVSFIEDQSSADQPFFLYLAFASPHTPWMPDTAHEGVSGAGQYGDFTAMTDTAVGSVMDALEKAGVAKNTLVIFTSDNGPYWRPNMVEQFDHRAAGPFRGMKADIWEGGHRMPFIVRWPNVVQPGTQSDQITVQTNLMATLADILQRDLPEGAGIDSASILPALQGDDGQDEVIVHHSSKGFYAVRRGKWKYATGLGSGGFSVPDIIEPEDDGPLGQLYDLEADPGETNNLYIEHPEIVTEMAALLEDIRAQQ